MRQFKVFVACCLSGLAACTPLVLAPGAAQVQVTKAPGDVAGCAPVGNLRVPKDTSGALDGYRAVDHMKNQTVGLGGNVALVTEGRLRMPQVGVAYKCPSRSGAGS
jgi:hypothetical protein